MIDIDKAIDKEINRIPLDTLIEFRRQVSTELFAHGGTIPTFYMPAFITPHSFLKAPQFDDQFWAYRHGGHAGQFSKRRWEHCHSKWPAKEGQMKGELERRNPRTGQWTKGWNEVDKVKFYWYNRKRNALSAGRVKLLKAVELASISCSFLSAKDRRKEDGQFRVIVLMTEQRSYYLRAEDPDVAREWLEEITRARKFALENETEEDKYFRLYTRRLEPRDGTVHVHDELEAQLDLEKEVTERLTGVKAAAAAADRMLPSGEKELSTTQKRVKKMKTMKPVKVALKATKPAKIGVKAVGKVASPVTAPVVAMTPGLKGKGVSGGNEYSQDV
eukprot:COSAG01_NODE_1109_length_11660_cov_40.459822_3_plen_331_part_00